MIVEEIIIPEEVVICGPYPYSRLMIDGINTFNIDFLEEVGGEESVDFEKLKNINKCFKFRLNSGLIDFVELFGEEFSDYWKLKYGVVYVAFEVSMAKESNGVLIVGVEDFLKIYHNNALIFSSQVPKKFTEGFHVIPIKLTKRNLFLFKIGRLAGRWRLKFKLLVTEEPIYVNMHRAVVPNAIKNEYFGEWIGLQVLALKDVKRLTVGCEGDSLWYSCENSINNIKRGELLHIPLFLMSKRRIDTDTTRVDLYFQADRYKKYISLNIDVVDSNSHRIATYLCPYDNSVQYFGYKPARPPRDRDHSLIVVLHGFKGTPTPSQLYGDKDWAIIASPSARGEVPYREIGLLQVLEIINILKSRFNIDEERIVLEGHSMGGYGTWYIATHVPHIFAGIVPLSSRADYDDILDKIKDWKGWEGITELIRYYNPIDVFENLNSLYIFISHGDSDKIVPVEKSRKAYRRLRDLGYNVIYEEIRGAPHVWGEYRPGEKYGLEALDRPSIEYFIKKAKRIVPKTIRVKLLDPRYRKYWWLELLDFSKYSEIEIELKSNILEIKKIRGVRSVRIDLDYLRENGLIRDWIIIKYKGKEVIYNASSSNSMVILFGNDKFVVSDEYKRVEENRIIVKMDDDLGLVGNDVGRLPFVEIFNDKFVILPCEAYNYCHRAARYIQYWWADYANGSTRIISYDELESYLDYNIVLVGGPKINNITRKIVSNYGLNNLNFDDYGYFILLRSIFDKKRYIGIVGGNSELSLKSVMNWDLSMTPNVLVYVPGKLGVSRDGIIFSKL